MAASTTAGREEETLRLRTELSNMRRSLSWRITKPLRSISKLFRRDVSHQEPTPYSPRAAGRVSYLSEDEVLSHFPPYAGPGQPDSVTDFLGVRTQLAFLPNVGHWSGKVLGHPVESDAPGQETYVWGRSEWIGTLRSVLEAQGSLTAVELGAGWGPWLVAAAAAARRKDIKKIHLAAVEGSKEHVEYLSRHFLDNGLDPADHFIFAGVVGTYDGTAKFPKLLNPSHDYGGQADFEGGFDPAEHQDKKDCPKLLFDEFEEVPCIDLNTLLQKHPRVDLIHCDIQGAEGAVLSASIDELTSRVRRIVVGTHSRHVEARLLDLFVDAGWALEAEEHCRMAFARGRKTVTLDGVQVWRNDGV